jgi:thiamine kinase-like enzyme
MNNWFTIPPGDAVVAYLVEQLWDRAETPPGWEAARLSKAAYLYREKASHWTVLVKFYTAKVGPVPVAGQYAANEFERTRQAQSLLLDGAGRAPQALGCYGGVLFLEYVDGLTLEDTIAIRRNRPGTLLPALEKTARLLSRLHSQGLQSGPAPNLHNETIDTGKFVQELAEYGVLAGNQLVVDALQRLIERWAADPAMTQYLPTLIHGDATTSNFVFAWNGGLVAIDWERMWTADPAGDLGRLTAEVSHSVQQHGGDYSEVEQLLQFTVQAYCQDLPSDWDIAALQRRARFYHASSTLRIARNGWLPRLERTAMVTQALALLTQ